MAILNNEDPFKQRMRIPNFPPNMQNLNSWLLNDRKKAIQIELGMTDA